MTEQSEQPEPSTNCIVCGEPVHYGDTRGGKLSPGWYCHTGCLEEYELLRDLAASGESEVKRDNLTLLDVSNYCNTDFRKHGGAKWQD